MYSFFSATLRMAGSLEKSSEVMKYMQQLVKVPEIQATMNEMSKEMMKVCAEEDKEAVQANWEQCTLTVYHLLVHAYKLQAVLNLREGFYL